jgi:hypothetical protein
MTQYAAWVEAQNLPECPAGLCHSVAVQMREAFPELTLVRGHYVVWGDEKQYPHWWLTTPDGEIVDPTAAQFGGMPGEYVPHVGDEPTGRCLDCGLYVFHGRSFCDDTCARAWKTWIEEHAIATTGDGHGVGLGTNHVAVRP